MQNSTVASSSTTWILQNSCLILLIRYEVNTIPLSTQTYFLANETCSKNCKIFNHHWLRKTWFKDFGMNIFDPDVSASLPSSTSSCNEKDHIWSANTTWWSSRDCWTNREIINLTGDWIKQRYSSCSYNDARCSWNWKPCIFWARKLIPSFSGLRSSAHPALAIQSDLKKQ